MNLRHAAALALVLDDGAKGCSDARGAISVKVVEMLK
jgi:hypothetical protein